MAIERADLFTVRARHLFQGKSCVWSSAASRTNRIVETGIGSCCLRPARRVEEFVGGTLRRDSLGPGAKEKRGRR
jgi:hypothetical protein